MEKKRRLVLVNILSLLLIFFMFSCDPEDLNPDKDGSGIEQPGNPDTGNPDTGNPDTGNPDTGNPDTGNPDTEQPIEYPQVDTQAVDLDAITVTEIRLFQILQTINPAVDAVKLYKTNITEEQMALIAANMSKDVFGNATDLSQSEKYEKIFDWVKHGGKGQIQYGELMNGQPVNNDPYEVYKNRQAVCQGYSNLLKVMCLIEGIPAVSANGLAYMNSQYMGHAWLYVYVDGQWKCSDPTNAATYDLKTDSSTDIFRPTSVELDLFEDDNFCYEYVDSHINVAKVKKSGKILTIPYSAGGFVVNAFSPNQPLPDAVEELVLGRNIVALTNGENTGGTLGLEANGKQIVQIHVDPDNAGLESYEGVIYKKDSSVPYFIPHRLSTVVLKPGQKTYGKEAGIGNRDKITEIVFPDDTTVIGAYTVENCSALRQVSVPKEASVDQNAFPAGVQVVTREASGQV